MSTDPFRCGDHVHHGPTGEDWLVAWCKGPDLAPCGWPSSIARTADCTLVRAATDDEHRRIVADIARGSSIHRSTVLGLYGEALGAVENGCGNG